MLFNQIVKYPLITLSVLVSTVTITINSLAQPASVFQPHLEEIKKELPLGLMMRLPSRFYTSRSINIDESKLVVRLFPSDNPKRFTISVFTCEKSNLPCLVGSFSVEQNNSINGKLELQRHIKHGYPITLDPKIRGYFMPGNKQNPPSAFSTMIWEQDNMFYSLSFPLVDRQNLLYIAHSMVHSDPIYRKQSNLE
jgi:hypothetical protein